MAGGSTINLLRFVPKFILSLFQGNSFYNNSYLLGQQGPVYISVAEPYKLYNEIAELRAVIDRDASMFSNMRIYKRDKKTHKLIEDVDLDKLLDTPNCMQSQNMFLKNYRQQFLAYGNSFIYANRVRSKGYPIALWTISPYYLQPRLTGKVYDQTSMNEIIAGYHTINTLALGDKLYSKDFEPQDILYTRINDLNNPIIGKSPIACMRDALTIIQSAYQRGIAINQHGGALGVISPKQNKEMGSSVPLTNKDRQQIEEQYGKDYGTGGDQRKILLSNVSVDFQSMSIPTKDLLLVEQIEAAVVSVCNVLHMNPQIFLTNTTYENLRAGIVQTYQDNIIPAADEFMAALTPFLNIPEGQELCASFEHLSILKENKLKGMQAIESIVKSLAQALEAGIIDKKQATMILETELGLNSASY